MVKAGPGSTPLLFCSESLNQPLDDFPASLLLIDDMAEKSAAEYQCEDFMTELPPVPEDEFCVFGTVRLQLQATTQARP